MRDTIEPAHLNTSAALISRRGLLRLALAAGWFVGTGGVAVAASVITRPIPRTGESLPVIGLGTWQTLDVGQAESARAPLREVMRDFARLGGKVIDSSPMYGRSESVVGDLGCSEPEVHTLVKGGTYTLIVGHHHDPSTGTYRLQLYNVPPPSQFSVKIGDKVRPKIPGVGAGMIENPGAEDIYVFNATPGQKVYFHLLERDKGMEYVKWRLMDDNGMEVFNTCLACTEPGAQTLTRGGTYSLTVGNTSNPATGNYAFEIGSQ
ncbi:MAG: hypothetical protein WD688_26040 [Candidatus Binatia bacterium]